MKSDVRARGFRAIERLRDPGAIPIVSGDERLIDQRAGVRLGSELDARRDDASGHRKARGAGPSSSFLRALRHASSLGDYVSSRNAGCLASHSACNITSSAGSNGFAV